MATKYATKENLAYAAEKQKALFETKTNAAETFVAKEAGKGLSKNDLTDELKEKYDQTATKVEALEATGGQANVIEKVTVNGTDVAVGANKTVDIKVITEAEVDQKVKTAVAGSYKVKGSIAFASLPAEGVEAGWIYNVTDAFTTTENFAEGAGASYPAGTNVVYTTDGKWDCMAGTYDFSGFVQKDDIEEISTEELDAMYA